MHWFFCERFSPPHTKIKRETVLWPSCCHQLPGELTFCLTEMSRELRIFLSRMWIYRPHGVWLREGAPALMTKINKLCRLRKYSEVNNMTLRIA